MQRIIDLSLTLEHGMHGVEIEQVTAMERDGWNASTYHLYSHTGTHMDAPVHYEVNGTTIDQIGLERCMGPAWVVDCSDVEPREFITIGHLGVMEERIQPGDIVLIRTGWSRYAGMPRYRDELPRISHDLAVWFAKRQISLLGIEPPAVADVHDLDEVREIHTILLEAGIIIVEGLANLDKIRRTRVQFMALPLKIKGGDGSPVRALAIEEND